MLRRCLPLAILIGFVATTSIPSQTPSAASSAKPEAIDADAVRLYAVLRNQTRTEAAADRLDELVKQLGHVDFQKRERASRELIGIGRPALPRLRDARQAPDLEISRRAETCIGAIEASLDKNAGYAAVCKLLEKPQRHTGLAELLFTYLPEADADTAEEIWFGMAGVAVRDGKVDPAVRAVLNDNAPSRRALAAFILGRYGLEADRDAVRERLTDPDPEVRLRAAQGLVAVHDKIAVPALIDLIENGPLEMAWQAEELLHWLAAGQAPVENVEAGAAETRRKCHAAWQTWWKDEETRFDWQRLDRDHHRPGLLMVCSVNSVWLVGCDGKPRWRMSKLEYPTSVQVLPGPRFLVLEPNSPRVTERDEFGTIKWQAAKLEDDQYASAQRLANGNTFVATDSALVEYGPDGQRISKHEVDDATNGGVDIGDAYKRRDGTVVIRTHIGVAEVTARGDPLRWGQVENYRAQFQSRMSVLPNGHCLLADLRRQRVVDVDLDGKVHWEHPGTVAASAEGLRNGNVVIGGLRDGRLYEVTRDGHVVWEACFTGQTAQVRDAYRLVRLGFDQLRASDLDLNSVANRIRDLKDNNPNLRRHAALALGGYGPKAKAAIPALLDGLDDAADGVRDCSIAALTRVGADGIPALLKAVRDPSAQVQTGAWRVLANLGAAAKPALPDLVAILRNPKEPSSGRQAAARVFGAMGAEGMDALPALLEMLEGNDGPVRFACASALAAAGGDKPEVVAALAKALKDPKYPEGQVGAANALHALGPKAVKAIPDLLEAAQNVSYAVDVRSAAVLGFGQMGDAARPVVPPLADLLKDGGQPEKVRIAIAQTFTALGLVASPAQAAVNEILRDNNLPDALAVEATNALTAQGLDAVPLLTLVVSEGNRKAKLTAIQNLQNMCETARSAIPALMETSTQDGDLEVRKQAYMAAKVIEGGGGRRGRGKW